MKKVIVASVLLPCFVFLAGSYFNNFVVKADYNAAQARNDAEHVAIKEALQEIKQGVNTLIEIQLDKLPKACKK